jgi:nucleotide-binding universal stress UspA family protein
MEAIRPSRRVRRHRNTRLQPYRILVASDGGPGSLGALHVAVLLARRKSAVVNALNVVTPFPHGMPTVMNVAPPPMIDDGARRAALEQLRAQLAGVRGTKGWAMRAAVGFSADTIVDAGSRWPASLVILGLGRHGFFDRLVRSDTAVSVARRTTVPVLAVPPDALRLPVSAIAAIDFSAASTDAAILSASVLGPNGRVTLLHASELIADDATPGSEAAKYTSRAREQMREVQEHVRRACKRPVESLVVPGRIEEELVHAASIHECDLIALGGRDASFIERLFTSSVRTRVLRQADCAVLVVPPRGGTDADAR